MFVCDDLATVILGDVQGVREDGTWSARRQIWGMDSAEVQTLFKRLKSKHRISAA